MITLGIILLLIGALIPKLAILFTLGLILLIVGIILMLLGASGHALGGRRWY